MLTGMILFLLLNFRGRLALPLCLVRFRRGSGMGLLAQVPLHPEVNSQNDGDDGCSAKHQNRKQNLHHHGNSGYQNAGRTIAFFAPPKRAFTRTTFVPHRYCDSNCNGIFPLLAFRLTVQHQLTTVRGRVNV